MQSLLIDAARRRTIEQRVLFALRDRPELLAKLTLGVVGYSVAHAALALSAGSVASALGTTPLDRPALSGIQSFEASIATASYVGLLAAIVKALAGTVLSASERRLGATVAGDLRVALVDGFLSHGMGMPAPNVLARLAVRLREVELAVVEGVLGRVRGAAQLLPLGVCLVVLSPRLALGAFIAVAPFAFVLSALRRHMRRASERAQRAVEDLERGVDELVRNVDLFRAYGAGERAIEAVSRSTALATSEAARLDGSRAFASGLNEVMAALAVVGVVLLAGRYGLPSSGSAAVPFAAVFFMAYRPLRDLGDAKAWYERGRVALEAVHGAEDAGHESPPASDAVVRPHAGRSAPHEITAIDFGGRAHGARASFRMGAGEILCLVGPTGSGKTTLLRAMLGLERCRGRLLVDGRDLTSAPAGPEARPFAWVPQEAPVVTATLLDNVALFGGAMRAREALDLVGALDVADPDEILGPGGRPLSGGERRLLSLARAFATELPVLLLDEPTEGLDADATRRVLDAIRRLASRRSILIATHRPEVVAVADRVVPLADDVSERAAE